MRYETLEHAVDLPRAGVCARRLARFERDFAPLAADRRRAQRDVARTADARAIAARRPAARRQSR